MDSSSSSSEVPGMESVVATVSGYHGAERFKLIKLIAQTGASYVGAMGRSTTHLVCWKFEGKKYDLARQLGTHIVSHRWFEDCLKERKRLPEDPYSMQSGIEAGPIGWQLPAVLDSHGKQKNISSSGRILLSDQSSDQSSALDFRRIEDKDDATCFEVVDLEWSDSHLVDENSFRLNNKTKGSKNSKRPIKVGKHDYGSNNKGNPILPANSDDNMPDSTSYSRNKRNLCDASGSGITGETARRSRRLLKKNALVYPLNPVMLACNLTENCNTLETNNHVSVDLDNFCDRMASTRQGIAVDSEDLPIILEESRRQSSMENNDIRDNVHVPKNSNSPSNRALSVLETLQKEYSEHIQVPDFCSVGVENGKITKGDEQGDLAVRPSETNLSCVICWTDYCSTRGILPCGHRFCYSCIQEWADCMNSGGKVSTCPLCKTGFSHIIKWEETTSSDQKIYSQSVPCDPLITDCSMVPAARHNSRLPDSVCYHCHNHEPEDLLLCCHICDNQWVHSYCLDPPLVPWTCSRCTDLRSLYQRFH